jgi:hypothetical protein
VESPLEITVIFSEKKWTLNAIDVARRLAHGLGSRIRLIVPHIVPFPVPLNEPLVDRVFLEQQFTSLVTVDPTDIFVDIRICRDRWQMLRESLIPHSVLVVSHESKLATALQAAGHSVVFLK